LAKAKPDCGAYRHRLFHQPRLNNRVDSNTVSLYLDLVTDLLSLEQLSARINAWCAERGVTPASGQSGESVSERNIRYYRTLGLVDAPEGGGYGEKHLLQLTAIRLLQAQGLPLRRIRELLYGRSLQELREIRHRGVADAQRVAAAVRLTMPGADELWRVVPLNEDFLLVSRRGTPLTPTQRDAVLAALQTGAPARKPHAHNP
jgi:DNA-binding transcriptional MerR regulator